MTSNDSCGHRSYSPGLEGVIAGETAISTVETGLTYRGYAIEDLAEHSNYEEVAYLILYGELPTAEQAAASASGSARPPVVPPEIIETLRHIPREAPSMDVLRSAVSLLAHWDPEDQRRHARRQPRARPSGCWLKFPSSSPHRQRLRTGQEPIAADRPRSPCRPISSGCSAARSRATSEVRGASTCR